MTTVHRFMTVAFGGENDYTGRSIKAAHDHLVEEKGLGTEHFDLVVGHLVSSLTELSVDPALIKEVKGVLAPLRSDFEGKKEKGEVKPDEKEEVKLPSAEKKKVRFCFCF